MIVPKQMTAVWFLQEHTACETLHAVYIERIRRRKRMYWNV